MERIRTKVDTGRRSSPEMLLDESTNWIATPPNIWHGNLKDSKFERNARLLHWVAFDTDFTLTKPDGTHQQWANLGITSHCKASSVQMRLQDLLN